MELGVVGRGLEEVLEEEGVVARCGGRPLKRALKPQTQQFNQFLLKHTNYFFFDLLQD